MVLLEELVSELVELGLHPVYDGQDGGCYISSGGTYCAQHAGIAEARTLLNQRRNYQRSYLLGIRC